MMQSEQNFQIRLRFSRPGLAPVERLISTIPCRLGRGPENDIDLGDASVSSNHAVIEWDSLAKRFTLRDLGSRNGIRRLANGEVVKNAAVPLESGAAKFVLGAIGIELEIVELTAQQTATLDVGYGAGRNAGQGGESQSLPSVRVVAGKVSGAGPKGAVRSIKMREPTGGIRIDRSKLGQVHARLNIGQNPQALRFSRAAEGLDLRGGTPSPRSRGTGLLWPGLIFLLSGSFFSSSAMMQGELGAMIPESLDGFIFVVSGLGIALVILLGTLMLTGFRFIIKKGDIAFGILLAQCFGAFSMANGASMLLHALSERPELVGFGGVAPGLDAAGSAIYWLFGIHGLMLLRSRAAAAGMFARYSPWVAATLSFIVMLVLPVDYAKTVLGELGQGMTVLQQSPPVPPFISVEESQERNPAATPSVEQAVMEFTVASQELDEKLARKKQGTRDSSD